MRNEASSVTKTLDAFRRESYARELNDILKNPLLTGDALNEAIERHRAPKHFKTAWVNKEILKLKGIETKERANREILRDIRERFINAVNAPLVSPKSSLLYQIDEARKQDKLVAIQAGGKVVEEQVDFLKISHVFLVQHDWSSVLANADGLKGGEYRMPFDVCAFEFSTKELRICVVFAFGEILLFVKGKLGWGVFRPTEDFLQSDETFAPQIRAMLIAMDAEVVETEIVRAPHRANKAREKRGRAPINDFHILSLANRRRTPKLEEATGTHASPRLHFRRGHWRHYENHKTWIKWTLVGNPDLGFVDKEYRL